VDGESPVRVGYRARYTAGKILSIDTNRTQGTHSSRPHSSGTRRLGPTRGLSYSAAAPRRARLSALRVGAAWRRSAGLAILLYIGTPPVLATELARAKLQ